MIEISKANKISAAVLLAALLVFTGFSQDAMTGSANVPAGSGSVMLQADSQEPEEGELHAKAAVLMDAANGRVLYDKNGGEVMPMASTTKIMTCIVALESGTLSDTVTASAYAASQPKVHLGMEKGRQYRMEDLLYSMMLESHNDSAAAVAEHIGAKDLALPEEAGRSREESRQAVEAFCGMMNQKARDIGCSDTFFVTPNGLDADAVDSQGNTKSHSTTAKDLAAIMRYCIRQSSQKEKFLEITGTSSYSFGDLSGKRTYSCSNHNAFLTLMDGALSGKTGFTGKAGYCYVGALEREGKCFTVALLACGWPNHKTWKWADSQKLMGYGLDNYTYHSFSEQSLDEDRLNPIVVENGRTDRIGGTASVKVHIEKPAEKAEGEVEEGLLLREDEKIEMVCEIKKKLTAPVRAGEEVGNVQYMVDGQLYRRESIVADSTVEPVDFTWCMEKIIEKFLVSL